MPIHFLTKFGDDWIKALKVIGRAIWLVIELVQDIMPIHILTKFGDDCSKASKVIQLTLFARTPQVKL